MTTQELRELLPNYFSNAVRREMIDDIESKQHQYLGNEQIEEEDNDLEDLDPAGAE